MDNKIKHAIRNSNIHMDNFLCGLELGLGNEIKTDNIIKKINIKKNILYCKCEKDICELKYKNTKDLIASYINPGSPCNSSICDIEDIEIKK
jgi:hypothetical protein